VETFLIVIAISRIYDLSRQRYVIIFKLQRVGWQKLYLYNFSAYVPFEFMHYDSEEGVYFDEKQ